MFFFHENTSLRCNGSNPWQRSLVMLYNVYRDLLIIYSFNICSHFVKFEPNFVSDVLKLEGL